MAFEVSLCSQGEENPCEPAFDRLDSGLQMEHGFHLQHTQASLIKHLMLAPAVLCPGTKLSHFIAPLV